jgi:hypothetical protein
MEEHHQRLSRRRRPVEARPHGGRADRQVLDPGDLGAWGSGFDTEPLRASQIRCSHGTGRRSGILPNGLDEGGQFGIGKRGIDRFGHAGQDPMIRTIPFGGDLQVESPPSPRLIRLTPIHNI